jgi:hypothetical protein
LRHKFFIIFFEVKARKNKDCVRDAEGGEAGTAPSEARGLPKRKRSPKKPDPSVSEGHAMIKNMI